MSHDLLDAAPRSKKKLALNVEVLESFDAIEDVSDTSCTTSILCSFGCTLDERCISGTSLCSKIILC